MIEAIYLPSPESAEESGLVAVGGDFSPALLLAAYANGIFPWPSEEFPLAWYAPDPRMVVRPTEIHVSRSLAKLRRSQRFQVTFDLAFPAVIRACAQSPKREQLGTWIIDGLREAFLELHALGLAHSVEVWRGDELVGGLYGLALGGMFCGESMFHLEPNASKLAFAELGARLAAWNFLFIDCQVHSDHLASLGAYEIPRRVFQQWLGEALGHPTRIGSWATAL